MDKKIVFVADNIRSLENIGSLFRTADGVGAAEVMCVGISGYPNMGEHDTRRPYLREKNHKMIQKTALSGIELPFRYFATASDALSYLQHEGYFIVCVEQTARSVQIFGTYEIQFPCALVLGHELDGVSPAFVESADLILEIPMYGKGKSLNVGVAAGIAGYVIRAH
jgi:tRNA G18 (ribose-2'-O)-methylase SpoU